MSAHTPGPWTYDSESSPTEFEPERVRYVVDANTIVVAQSVQTLADARLIAAAPTMHDYIATRAADSDAEAIAILENINGNR